MEGIYIVKAAAFLGAAFAMSVGSIGPSIGQGMIGKQACDAIGKYPESSGKIRLSMIMGMVFIETSALYCFLISLILLIFNR
jgi:F-type H+-transporting ATPase subunit c